MEPDMGNCHFVCIALSVQFPLMSIRSVCSWWLISKCHWYAPRCKRWHDDSPSLSHGRTPHNCILITHLNAISNELGHWHFICVWHMNLSFAMRFSNMPYFKQPLRRNAITKCHKKLGYIYIYMYICICIYIYINMPIHNCAVCLSQDYLHWAPIDVMLLPNMSPDLNIVENISSYKNHHINAAAILSRNAE